MKPHAQYLAAYHETGSAKGAAVLLGCSRRVVYAHLHRAGVPVRPYRRRPTLLLITPLISWQVHRMREIEDEFADLRDEIAWLKRRTPK